MREVLRSVNRSENEQLKRKGMITVIRNYDANILWTHLTNREISINLP
jgi:hypothetical protein